MAVRPLFNGAARCSADNNTVDAALLVRYTMRAQVSGAPLTTNEDIDNRTFFQLEAGQSYTIFWDIRKFGAGTAVGARPDQAFIRIFPDDDSNDARTGAVQSFTVLNAGMDPAGNTGSVVFTPTTAGTFRIQLEMQNGAGDFSPTSTQWRVINDGFFAAGGASIVSRAFAQDKGRLRSGTRINALSITERGSTAPATFAYTGTEAVRIETTTSAAANKTTTNETFRFRNRRNGTSTVDFDIASTVISGTVQRTETLVDDSWPAARFTYDTVVAITTNSALHTNNTRQYDTLGGQAASGVWVHLVGVGTGLVLVDYATVERIASHAVDARVTAAPHLWQMDDDVVGTPPMSKHEPSKSALVSSYSGFASRIVNARNEGINGISANLSMDPRGAGSTRTTAVTTATRGGEAGWTELVQLGPFVVGGGWDVALDITAPATIDNNAHLLASTDVVTILASDPRIQLRGYINLLGGHKGHFTEGDAIVVNMTVRSFTTHVRIDPARVTNPKVGFVRYRSEDHRLEYLSSNMTTWVLWEPTAAMSVFDLTPSANDARNYILVFNDTTGWHRDVTGVEFTCEVDGTPYTGVASREETGAANDHSFVGGAIVTAQATIS